jgi:hypothetical protein
MMNTFVLGDGKRIEVERGIGVQLWVLSKLMREMYERKEDLDDDDIPLPYVSAETFSLVLEYIQHHHTHPIEPISKPLKGNKLEENVPEWDANLVKHDNKIERVPFSLVLAANYLGVEPLVDLCCASIACYLKSIDVPSLLHTRPSREVLERFELQCPAVLKFLDSLESPE